MQPASHPPFTFGNDNSLSVVGRSWLTTMMCDACGEKISFLGKKVCGDCRQAFCSSCVHTRQPKGPHICPKCRVFSGSVMERTQLERLNFSDLQYFTRIKGIRTPAGVSHENLVDIILEHQAKELSERAKKAQQQVRGATVGTNEPDFVMVDGVNQYEQGTSVDRPSESSQTTQTGLNSGASGSGQTGLERVDDRDELNPESKRMKGDFDISNVMNLGDLEEESQISELSVKQLKIILKRNCLDYKDCVEKQELMDRVKRLWQAREKGKEMEALLAAKGDHQAESDFLCKVCMDAPVDCVLLECGHMLACVTCGRQLAECPVCRQLVVRAVHAFKV